MTKDERTLSPAGEQGREELLLATPIQSPSIPSPPEMAPTVTCDSCNPDAMVGPSDEYLCDGGDFGLPVGVRADWTVQGLEQEDAVAHYDTMDGRMVVEPSNRVCIYAPRFAAVRRVDGAAAHERRQLVEIVDDEAGLIEADETTPVATSLQLHAAAIHLSDRAPDLLRMRDQAGATENLQGMIDVYGSLAAYADLHVVRTGQLDGAEMPRLEKAVAAAVTWTGDQAVQVVFETKQAVANVNVKQVGGVYGTDGPERPRLRLVKLASCGHALPGEEIEFTLRFDNVGDQVIGNVTIIDNLATRLEYVPGSARSSVDARFVEQPNAGGSTVLRWEIGAPVQSGEGGILQFKCKVR